MEGRNTSDTLGKEKMEAFSHRTRLKGKLMRKTSLFVGIMSCKDTLYYIHSIPSEISDLNYQLQIDENDGLSGQNCSLEARESSDLAAK